MTLILGVSGAALLIFAAGYTVGRGRALYQVRLLRDHLYHDAGKELCKAGQQRRMARWH